jgi:hypothetical protein
MLYRSLTIAFSLVLWAGLASAQAAPEARSSSLMGANGQVIGQNTVTAAPNGVILRSLSWASSHPTRRSLAALYIVTKRLRSRQELL